MPIRDIVLPVLDVAHGLIQSFGLRRFSVTMRRRIWSGTYPGDGVPTNQDIVLSPEPRVRLMGPGGSPLGQMEYLASTPDMMKRRIYRIDRIVPAWSQNGQTGGFDPQQLIMKVNPDEKRIEPIVILVGDDGYLRECVQQSFAIDRAFTYSMIVEETERPKPRLASIAISPGSPTVVHGHVIALEAVGTFTDGNTSNISNLVAWRSSDTTKATVDLLGNVTGVASGTSTITAQLGLVIGSTSLSVT